MCMHKQPEKAFSAWQVPVFVKETLTHLWNQETLYFKNGIQGKSIFQQQQPVSARKW